MAFPPKKDDKNAADDKSNDDGEKKLPSFLKKKKDVEANKGVDKSSKTDDKSKDGKKPPFGKSKDDQNAKDDTQNDSQKGGKPPFGKKDGDSETQQDGKKPGFGKKDDGSDLPGMGKKKVKNPEITEKVKVDFEPEITNEELVYIFEGDLSDVDQYAYILEDYLSDITAINEEGISIGTRLKKRATLRRSRSRVAIGRERSLRHRATTERIMGRARRTAIENMKKRFAGGRSPENLTYSEKERVERQVHRRQKALTRMARRLVRQKRELDTKRLQH